MDSLTPNLDFLLFLSKKRKKEVARRASLPEQEGWEYPFLLGSLPAFW